MLLVIGSDRMALTEKANRQLSFVFGGIPHKFWACTLESNLKELPWQLSRTTMIPKEMGR